ncbi:Uncharacterised protein [Serratia fonticola]|uniref:Uncharacterized protein n=1 Tax=Serratia fonticola TaxID=47917 RepID=A0A4U9U9Z4_SERFO|nr:Uncharacterised protein [Serratia fonticola]
MTGLTTSAQLRSQKSDDALTPSFLNAIYANTAALYAVKLANARC